MLVYHEGKVSMMGNLCFFALNFDYRPNRMHDPAAQTCFYIQFRFADLQTADLIPQRNNSFMKALG